jgi:RHS repeat-associated protein
MSRLALIKPEVAMKKALRYVISLALMLAFTAASASTIVYYHNDIAGSPVVATDASRQVLWRESYRPYGERLTNSAASVGNDVWFTSRRQDVDTGLVYMGARYYDPVIGRFMATDPAGFDEKNLHSFNRYAYANNNPLKYVDPDGREAYVIFHKAAWNSASNPLPFNHAAILLAPNTPADFVDRRGWSSASEGSGITATLGAQPGSPNGQGLLGNLQAAPNFPGDSLENAVGAVTLRPPKGLSDTDWINALINAAGTYKNDVRYGFSPSGSNEVYNSNSFVSGVIEKAGGTLPDLPVSAPGYRKPLPLE